jgi:hypothetical protein
MQVKVLKMRDKGVELHPRIARDGVAHRGLLVILDVTDQGLRRPAKVARLMQADVVRHELTDVHIVWANEGRFTLSGFERLRNSEGQMVDYAQSWLCALDAAPMPEVVLSKLRNVRPQG